MKNNSYKKIKDYFQYLVSQHTEINAFAGYFNRDLQHQISSRNGITSPYLALFRYELGLDGHKQNTVAVRKIGFAVMFENIPPDDFQRQYQAIDDAEALALSVLSRIQYDNHQKEHLLFNTFIKDSVQILPVELSNYSFGVEVYFDLKNPQNLKVNPQQWNDIHQIC